MPVMSVIRLDRMLGRPIFFSYFLGGGGGSVGFPRAWFRSSSKKCLRKLPVLLGSAADTVSICLCPLPAVPFRDARTRCLARAQRLARVAAVTEFFDGPVDAPDAVVESRASKDLPRRACQTERGEGAQLAGGKRVNGRLLGQREGPAQARGGSEENA